MGFNQRQPTVFSFSHLLQLDAEQYYWSAWNAQRETLIMIRGGCRDELGTQYVPTLIIKILDFKVNQKVRENLWIFSRENILRTEVVAKFISELVLRFRFRKIEIMKLASSAATFSVVGEFSCYHCSLGVDWAHIYLSRFISLYFTR